MISIRPLKLKHNRIERPFNGGYLLDMLQDLKNPQDGYHSESWIASTTEVFNGKKDNKYGLSKCVINGDEYFLKDLINIYPYELLGKKHIEKFGVNTALLVKLIDSFSRLMIQVHPTKDYAKKYLGSDFGKTEAWHILDIREDLEENPYVYLGFKKGITRERWKQAFLEQDIDGMIEMLHKIYVNIGDTIFIPSGVPHALGGGCLVIEIQEPTDFTMRVERQRLDGQKLSENMIHNGLGIEKMLDCFNYEGLSEEEIIARYLLSEKEIIVEENFKSIKLVGDKFKQYFTMEGLEVNKKVFINKKDKFCISTVIDGIGKLSYLDKEIELKKGDEIFIPESNRSYTLEGSNLKIINCYPPEICV